MVKILISAKDKFRLLAIFERKKSFSDKEIYRLPLDCKIPVISAMQRHGIGGGLVMGLFSDFLIFSKESVYTANFMKFGFTPGMGSTLILKEKFGLGLTEKMLFTAGQYRGIDLEKRGISFPVLPRKDVLPYAYAVASQISEKPRDALIVLKDCLVSDIGEN